MPLTLNEAAEIARRHLWDFIGAESAHAEANRVLIDAALSWLDPTPITEEWLRANGKKEGYDFMVKGVRFENLKGRWCAGGMSIQTLGELRTLLRLRGAQEKENDA